METLVLSLRALRMEDPLNDTGPVLVLAELVLPRPGIASRPALKRVDLRRGKRSLARAPFHESALLKERVEGPFGLKVAVTRPHPEWAGLLQALLASGIGTVGDLLATGVGPAALRPLIREPFDLLEDRLGDDAPDFIAAGGVDLDPEAGLPKTLAIPLHLTRALRQSELPPGPKARDRRKSAVTHRKGKTVGELRLSL